MPSREPGYSGCLTPEDVRDDLTDLAGIFHFRQTVLQQLV